MERNTDFERYFVMFRDFLQSELELNGLPMVKELTYRFAMVQFRDTRDFEPGKIEFIPKVLAHMQSEMGEIFEKFAKECFDHGYNLDFINETVRQWLIKIINEIVPAQQV
ncbi:MAG TPA: hypothetical protein PL195_02955 [bacterium]|mgnify:FL=1|jgi:hypothetical protein|nr:hypothetical protein [bacterium]HNW15466.1 hypothetical protein [bacterium]HQI04202.1 hypothetical protein [bacterium]